MSLQHKHAILDALMAAVDEDTALGIIEHRIKLGARYALTERSARMLAKQLNRCPDPIAAAEEMIVRGWQGIKPEWVQKSQPRSILQAGMNLIGEMNGAASNRGGDSAAQFLPAAVRH